jgi:hypothetical protein
VRLRDVIPTKWKIVLLVGCHAVATPAVAWLSVGSHWPSWSSFALTVVEEAQITLLAIWLVLGTARIHWRILSVVLGLCLESVIDFCWLWGGFGLQVTGLAGAYLVGYCSEMLAASIALACIRTRFQLRQADPESSNAPAFQFSIQHLMLLTFVVSVLLGLARFIRFRSFDFAQSSPFTLENLTALTEDAVPAALITSVIVWAAMAPGRPHLRVILAIMFAGCMGCGGRTAKSAATGRQVLHQLRRLSLSSRCL